MRGNILLLGASDRLATALEQLLEGTTVRTATNTAETEGLGADVVVVASDHPFEELAQVRVHPYLSARPVVLSAPGHKLDAAEWRYEGVWPVTSTGFEQLEDLVRSVGEVLGRLHHPSALAAARTTAA